MNTETTEEQTVESAGTEPANDSQDASTIDERHTLEQQNTTDVHQNEQNLQSETAAPELNKWGPQEGATSEGRHIQPSGELPPQDISQMSTVLIKKDSLTADLLAQAAMVDQSADNGQADNTEQAQHGEEPIHEHKDSSLTHLKNIITGSLPALPKLHIPKTPILGGESTGENKERPDDSLLKRVQRFILGEPQQSTSAAALIETPMRIQPKQGYSIRVNVLGRNKANNDQVTGGLSSLGEGETVHIEVRSALYQNYAYIVQQADVTIPGTGYVAEVTMPMQALSSGPSGRRERLHIFFMDDNRSPLYEKPFVIELFVSHLVQSGREGHNVLSIPL